ncbi:MAG TPA: RHS repeat-associated core domain-containing protein, partial [Anaerolineales bacterium]|nr:RHS repeat-associated core domain-containing protein [Anaerolineales bacterium]
GNRTAQSDCTNGSCVDSSWVYNQFNQVVSLTVNGITTAYSYDRDGNRTAAVSSSEKSTYEWNAESKLTNAWVQILQGNNWVSKDGKAEAYRYDSMGRRTKTYTLDPDIPTYPTLARETVYGRGWEELQRRDGVGTAQLTTTDILSLPGGLVPRKLAGYSNGSASYYQLDALGSGRAVTGAGGAVAGGFTDYGDFGTRLSPAPTQLAPSFTGYEHDAYTGLEYAKNRYYDPATASFISSDPYPVDHSDLLGANLYNYVQGNPVNSTDPLGWFVITGFSTSRIYFKTEQNETKNWIAPVFDVQPNKLIVYYFPKQNYVPVYVTDPSKIIPTASRGYAPFCDRGVSAKCNSNLIEYLSRQAGQQIYDYSKAGLVPVSELTNALQPQPTPTPRYNRNTAVDYAWYYSITTLTNSETYYTFGVDKGIEAQSDCTNFVSQALWAGGIRIDNDDNYPGWNSAKAERANGSFDDSMLAWIRTDNLYELMMELSTEYKFTVDTHLGSSSENGGRHWGNENSLDDTYYEWLKQVSGVIQMGDLVFYDWSDTNYGNPWEHVAIVTDTNSNVPIYGDGYQVAENISGIRVTEHGTNQWLDRKLPRLIDNTNAYIKQISILHINY